MRANSTQQDGVSRCRGACHECVSDRVDAVCRCSGKWRQISNSLRVDRNCFAVLHHQQWLFGKHDRRRHAALIYRLSGDYNPLHTDEVYTREAAGYPRQTRKHSAGTFIAIGSPVGGLARPRREGGEAAMKVLLVDDSPTARNYIRHILGNLGIRHFTEAQNGKQACALVEREFFDLIVTDYNMPEMDGREFTEFVRTRSGQSSVPILMVSSEQNRNRLAAVQNAGVSALCDKPFDPRLVRDLILKLLASR